MNKVTSATTLLLGLILSLPAAAQNPNFTVTGTVKDMEGVVITMYDDATRQTMDSIVVSDNKFQLQGRADSAMMVGLYSSDYSMYADLLVMPGSQMTVDMVAGEVTGNKPTEQLNRLAQGNRALMKERTRIAYQMMAAGEDPAFDSLKALYHSCDDRRKQLMDSLGWDYYKENINNPAAAHILFEIANVVTEDVFLDKGEEPTPAILRLFSLYESAPPAVKEFPSLKRTMTKLQSQAAIAPGNRFRDFEAIDYITGKPTTLGEKIAGHLAVVDFWASWCGPCRKEILETLKPLHEKYADSGLVVIGVDIWDKIEDHDQAVKELGIQYPQIVDTIHDNAGLLYGLKGVPYVLLIDPKGTIIGNFRGEKLIDAVEKSLGIRKSSFDK
ncbi:MAG: AhpC/TSA family protein [Bacteroidales bacterium]|nr:AhpC/TSA family protein [Bacteroidales bacterium]